jgi:hypothetical protein
MIEIVFPSGSHGSFLTFLLNSLSGVNCEHNNELVYDRVTYRSEIKFISNHTISNNPHVRGRINIVVHNKSYLKYIVMCLSRTAGYDYSIEDFNKNTFDKLKKHVVLNHFITSLSTISGQSSGDVDFQSLREWARLCFFACQGSTITQILKSSLIKDSNYTFDFEWFYNPILLIQKCHDITDTFDIRSSKNILPLLDNFYAQNRYKYVDVYPELIIDSIKNKKLMHISNTNFLQEAWIDNWLVENYNIDPLLKNNYFSNTLDIVDHYNL